MLALKSLFKGKKNKQSVNPFSRIEVIYTRKQARVEDGIHLFSTLTMASTALEAAERTMQKAILSQKASAGLFTIAGLPRTVLECKTPLDDVAAAYRDFIATITALFLKEDYSHIRKIICLEPTQLLALHQAQDETRLQRQQTYTELLAFAVSQLSHIPNVFIYIDLGGISVSVRETDLGDAIQMASEVVHLARATNPGSEIRGFCVALGYLSDDSDVAVSGSS